eukprot:Gregarina_sp_Poly_1__4339@NODE_2351_length_2250_cov_59_163078_g1500_i0_p1_GENE_NODE_2351_length_2250_cov_59_163078_g1500_i0NODE_2351_length_2250_cov_59_163078_g1500_i0_p1_ORF_typecomplete_len344_score53_44Efg1/PF10153_9/1_4Efg1/PF10153_9/1_7e03_NODE_2351_length_2250_cov_59_163078_g1500_i05701601
MDSWDETEAIQFITKVLGPAVIIPRSISGKWLVEAAKEGLLASFFGAKALTLKLAIEAHKNLSYEESLNLFKEEDSRRAKKRRIEQEAKKEEQLLKRRIKQEAEEKKAFHKFFEHVKAGRRGSGVAHAEVPLDIVIDDSVDPSVVKNYNLEPESDWENQVRIGLQAILKQMKYGNQADENTLCRVFYVLLGQSLAAAVKVGLKNEIDAVTPYGPERTVVELKIGHDIEKAARQLAVCEAQRLELDDPTKRNQYRTRETFCVSASRGFGLKTCEPKLDIIYVQRVTLHYREDRCPMATVSMRKKFCIYPGELKLDEALRFYNLFRSLGKMVRLDGGVDSDSDDE